VAFALMFVKSGIIPVDFAKLHLQSFFDRSLLFRIRRLFFHLHSQHFLGRIFFQIKNVCDLLEIVSNSCMLKSES